MNIPVYLKIICVFAFLFFHGQLTSGQTILGTELSITTESKEGEIRFYATNDDHVDMQVELQLFDAKSGDEIAGESYHIIPAKSRKLFFRSVSYSQSIRYSYRYMMGNPLDSDHTSGYIYNLPYGNGTKFMVVQGNRGSFSHKNRFAIDFAMPDGTPVHAARNGKVIRIKTDSQEGGKDPSFAEDGNYISILHNDGTIAHYVHLRTGGSVVRLGENVQKGQLIGYSGNTGFSTEPHLHFEVQKPEKMKLATIPVTFRLDLNTTGVPETGKFYTSWH